MGTSLGKQEEDPEFKTFIKYHKNLSFKKNFFSTKKTKNKFCFCSYSDTVRKFNVKICYL